MCQLELLELVENLEAIPENSMKEEEETKKQRKTKGDRWDLNEKNIVKICNKYQDNGWRNVK